MGVKNFSIDDVKKIAAFSDGEVGGNPAGVYVSSRHPSDIDMQRIASDVGFSETAFAYPTVDGFRVRYFSPESEVSFCGHATIALGAFLASSKGPGEYFLALNDNNITVEGFIKNGVVSAALQSPPTTSEPAGEEAVSEMLELFGYFRDDLHPKIEPAKISAGANHLLLPLKSRESLSAMEYKLEAGRSFMRRNDLVTIILAYPESSQVFHTRNPFASGGVYEDPATGAATAAFAGYLRDIKWPHNGAIDIIQGEDMGVRSLLKAYIPPDPGTSIRVFGSARFMD